MSNVLVEGKGVELCVVCGTETTLVDREFEAPICSTSCSSDLWNEYLDHVMWGSIRKEMERAGEKHGSRFTSAHEAYGVMREELEEVWDAIRAKDIPHAKVEAVQLAGVCIKFLRSMKS